MSNLWLDWPPTKVPPEKPNIWLRGQDGGVLFLNTQHSHVVPLFLRPEAAKVVAAAIQNRFGCTVEIRCVVGISRSDFEQTLRGGNELQPSNLEYHFVWEDQPEFLSLLLDLKINVGVR
ncbi:MAG: hypothetical protein ABSC89_08275 [Verrucomicrobiota bacterium]|jgi:hypothetical protein